jgi:hypothetical protein
LSFHFEKEFDETKYLKTMLDLSKTDEMRIRLKLLIDEWEGGRSDSVLKNRLFQSFQIRAVDAVSVVMWCLCKYWRNPVDCIVKCIGFGGDTDTTASILGGILGTMYGSKWIPELWLNDLENEEFGRNYAIKVAEWLSELDFTTIDAMSPHVIEKNSVTLQDPETAITTCSKILDQEITSKLRMDLLCLRAQAYFDVKKYDKCIEDCSTH